MAAGRLTLLKALRSELSDLASDDFPIAEIAIEGVLEEALLSKSAVEVEEDYQKNLNYTRARDMAAGRTLSGPHRSDFLVRHRDKDMAADQCSTGEQKALLLNLVLAHTALLGKARRDTPTLLLLDEVAAHFDENRRETLFKRLESLKAQPWLTGTDAHLFASLRAQKFSVSSGAITAL